MKKQMEGNEEQRRAAAADARDDGQAPSEAGVTTGASKQRQKLSQKADHEDRLRNPGRGKQQPDQFAADPRPGSTPSRRGADDAVVGPTDGFPPRDGGDHADAGDLDDRDERVFRSLVALEDEDSAPTLSDIAREADIDVDDATTVMQRLINDHDLVQELGADPEAGHRYRVKARA